jgi:hypothetical protein
LGNTTNSDFRREGSNSSMKYPGSSAVCISWQ